MKTTLSVFEIVHAGLLVDTLSIFTVYFVDDGVVRKSSFNWENILFFKKEVIYYFFFFFYIFFRGKMTRRNYG